MATATRTRRRTRPADAAPAEAPLPQATPADTDATPAAPATPAATAAPATPATPAAPAAGPAKAAKAPRRRAPAPAAATAAAPAPPDAPPPGIAPAEAPAAEAPAPAATARAKPARRPAAQAAAPKKPRAATPAAPPAPPATPPAPAKKPRGARPKPAAEADAAATLDLVAAVQATLQALPVADTADTVAPVVADIAVNAVAETAADTAPEAAAPVAASGPRHSAIVIEDDGLRRHLRWLPGRDCPPELRQAAAERLDAQGHLRPHDDAALPLLLRLAAEARHRLDVDEAVWPQLAADRDARQRLHLLERAYPEGPASPALQTLLQATALPPFQAEGALFAVVAGRALIADERGLGKRVQAIAAATLWRRHFGVQRVLVLCTPGQRADWQRSWSRLAGAALAVPPQVIEGPLHQRQALWSGAAEVRILSPEALDSDAAHLAHWAPQLLIIDEPQQLSGWNTLQAPHALVLCGAPLAQPMSLLHGIVDWLDQHRQGALQALQRVQAAREQGLALDEDELERLDDGLSRLMLQRLRSEVAEQLPPLVHSERLVPMAPPQREAHERLRQTGARLLAAWQDCGYLSDADQWALSLTLRALGTACHRSDPADPDSPLAEATVATLQAQLDDWAATGTQPVALVCPQPADRAQLQARLRFDAGLQWLAPGESPAADVAVVLQVGVPWRLRRPRRGDTAPAGQQWVHLAAQDSLELGLFDTAAARLDTPRGPAESGGRGFLGGAALAGWLQACVQAWRAAPTPG